MNQPHRQLDPSFLPPTLLERIKHRRVHARTVKPGGVRITTRSGTQFVLPTLADAAPVGENTSVYVWWTPAGLVCAPVAEIDAEESRHADLGEMIKRAREELAKARAARALPRATAD
jgi:hypothetical protein